MAEKLYSSIIDAMLDDGPDYGAVGLDEAKSSGDALLDIGHRETDAAFVRAVEGDRSGIMESSANARLANKKRQAQRREGTVFIEPFASGITSNPSDWRGKAATVCSDDGVLNDVSISMEKAKGTTVENKTKKVSDEVIRAAIRKQVSKGISKEKIAFQLEKLAENVIFNRSSAHEYLDSGGLAETGMEYWAPNKNMEMKQFTAAKNLAKARTGATDKGRVETPIIRVTQSTTQTAASKRATPDQGADFTVETVMQQHKAGQTLEKIYTFGAKSAGVVRASEVIKKFVASLKMTNTKVALSQIDCRFLKGKLAEQNAIIGASKCSSCSYRTGMHCGLTGGTLLTFPGMDKMASNHKVAAGAPKDGHQMMTDFGLKNSRMSDINIQPHEFQEVEMDNVFKLEF